MEQRPPNDPTEQRKEDVISPSSVMEPPQPPQLPQLPPPQKEPPDILPASPSRDAAAFVSPPQVRRPTPTKASPPRLAATKPSVDTPQKYLEQSERRYSVPIADARRNQEPVPWKPRKASSDDPAVIKKIQSGSTKTHTRKSAASLESILANLSTGDKAQAAQIVLSLLQRKSCPFMLSLTDCTDTLRIRSKNMSNSRPMVRSSSSATLIAQRNIP